jgi:hypothetical protein
LPWPIHGICADGPISGGYPGDDYKGGQTFNKIDKGKMSEDTGCGRVVEVAH